MRTYSKLSRKLKGFHDVGTAFTLFSIVNMMIYLSISFYQPLIDVLKLSTGTPWGIITSAFTHRDLPHLAGNLQGFVIATFLFVVACSVHPAAVRRRWSRAFLWLGLASGVFANVADYPLRVLNPGSSAWGASGVVYGAIGVVLAASIQSLPDHFRVMWNERRRWKGRRRTWRLFKLDRRSLRTMPGLLTLSTVLSFVTLIFMDTRGFLGEGPSVNSFVHGFGFLIGFVGGMVLFRSRKRR